MSTREPGWRSHLGAGRATQVNYRHGDEREVCSTAHLWGADAGNLRASAMDLLQPHGWQGTRRFPHPAVTHLHEGNV